MKYGGIVTPCGDVKRDLRLEIKILKVKVNMTPKSGHGLKQVEIKTLKSIQDNVGI